MVFVWPAEVNRGCCLRAEEMDARGVICPWIKGINTSATLSPIHSTLVAQAALLWDTLIQMERLGTWRTFLKPTKF